MEGLCVIGAFVPGWPRATACGSRTPRRRVVPGQSVAGARARARARALRHRPRRRSVSSPWSICRLAKNSATSAACCPCRASRTVAMASNSRSFMGWIWLPNVRHGLHPRCWELRALTEQEARQRFCTKMGPHCAPGTSGAGVCAMLCNRSGKRDDRRGGFEMSPRARLTLSAAAPLSPHGDAGARRRWPSAVAPPPCSSRLRPGRLAKAPRTSPRRKTAPPPAPNGCPFRNGKLELIA